MITSPDQHKAGRPRAARVMAIVTALAIVSLLIGGSYSPGTTAATLIIAGLLVLAVVVDAVMRRNGLRR